MRYYEYYVLLLLVVLGLLLLVSANDLISLYLLMELQSLGFYLLIVFKSYTAYGVEASLKYLIVGAFTSGMYLFGVSILYSYTGLLDFDDIYRHLAYISSDMEEMFILFSLVLILVSFLFKLGVFPFHMWLPDVYEGAPTIVTLLLAILPKFGFMVLLIKLLYYVFKRLKTSLYIILNSSIVGSWVVGSGGALYQVKIKRFLAYSAISNMGFILVGLLCNNILGLQSLFFYLLVYIILTLTVFTHVLELRSGTHNKLMKLLRNLTSLSKVNLPLSYSLTLTFFSMAGIPPLSGFLSKFNIFYAGISSSLFLLLLISLVFSVISVIYYIRVIRILHFTKVKEYVYLKPISYLSGCLLGWLSTLSIYIFILPDFFYNLTFLLAFSII